MRKIILGLAAIAALGVVTPAAAQVTVRGGDNGVSVRIGERPHYRYHRNHWRNSYADCRVIKTRTHRPNGTVVVKTRRVCD